MHASLESLFLIDMIQFTVLQQVGVKRTCLLIELNPVDKKQEFPRFNIP